MGTGLSAIPVPLLLLSFLSFSPFTLAQQVMADALAAQYALTTSTAFPFPTATLTPPDTNNLLVSQWSLGKGRIQEGLDNIAFVADPFPNSPPTGAPGAPTPSGDLTVLQVTYPQGSFSQQTGGTQFYNLWNGTTFNSMLLSYEVAFDSNFNWVKGGKLPGLRGGLSSTGCSGGNAADGRECFSSRMMWRRSAAGEGYAYIPPVNGLCDRDGILCDPDFGISIQRGSFGFQSGRWQRVAMLVRMNDPPNVANGNIQIYFNDLEAFSQTDLQLRATDSLSINGLFFSTFFGGNDDSWATPRTQHTYFRNIRMWGSSAPSNLTGEAVRSGASHTASLSPSSVKQALLLIMFSSWVLSSMVI